MLIPITVDLTVLHWTRIMRVHSTIRHTATAAAARMHHTEVVTHFRELSPSAGERCQLGFIQWWYGSCCCFLLWCGRVRCDRRGHGLCAMKQQRTELAQLGSAVPGQCLKRCQFLTQVVNVRISVIECPLHVFHHVLRMVCMVMVVAITVVRVWDGGVVHRVMSKPIPLSGTSVVLLVVEV